MKITTINKVQITILGIIITALTSCMTADEIRGRADLLKPNEYIYKNVNSNSKGETGFIAPKDVKDALLKDQITLLDLRPISSFKKECIKTAFNVELDSNFTKNVLKITNQKPIAIYADKDSLAAKAMHLMNELGYSSVHTIKGGIKAWKTVGNKTISLKIEGDRKKLDVDNFYKAIKQNYGKLIDVRTPIEFENYHIPGAIMIDIKSNNYKSKFDKLDRNIPLLIYCRSGPKSQRTIPILEEMGFEVLNFEKGMLEWRKQHMPIQGKNVKARDVGEEGC